ncbi:unnamed protein product, partial [marine sediment metagenome]
PEKKLTQIVDVKGIESIKKGKEVSELIRSSPLALD